MTSRALCVAVRDTMEQHVGVALTPHQFRHLAARRYLDAFPGHYESVRQLLGHKEMATTMRHYAGAEQEAAVRRLDAILFDRREQVGRAKTPAKARGASR